MHQIDDLIQIFNACFLKSHETCLIKGGDEPIYLPKDNHHAHHRICFAHGYFSSGLHEIAHWLIAGPQRRLLTDFGYWYEPDGRSQVQQSLFESVEIKPQAIEWILSDAAMYPYRVSIDNLTGETGDSWGFKKNILQQVKSYCETGLPPRARKLRKALAAFYGQEAALTYHRFENQFEKI